MTFFKSFILIVPFYLFFSSCFCVESETQLRNLENRIQLLEENHPKFYSPITPNAGPRTQGGMDLFLEADFIYWTARLDTLTYAQTGREDIRNRLNAPKGSVYAVDWGWDPGFKTALGWNFDHGGWDALIRYTWFYTKADDSKRSRRILPTFDVLPPDLPFLVLEFIDLAHARFYLHYQVGDFELARNYYVNRFLKMRPFIGLKGTWQKQKYHVFYDSIRGEFSFNSGEETVFFGLQSRHEQMLWGIGARIGLNTSWQFNQYFSLYANLALSGIWLHYHINRNDTLIVDEDGTIIEHLDLELEQDIQFVNMQAKHRLVKPVLEVAIGLRAESDFDDSRIYMLFQVGWESQIWINQTLYISTDNHFDRFDLSLHGLTAKLRLDF